MSTNLASIGSDNGLSPAWHQSTNGINSGLLPNWAFRNTFLWIFLIKLQQVSLKQLKLQMHLQSGGSFVCSSMRQTKDNTLQIFGANKLSPSIFAEWFKVTCVASIILNRAEPEGIFHKHIRNVVDDEWWNALEWSITLWYNLFCERVYSDCCCSPAGLWNCHFLGSTQPAIWIPQFKYLLIPYIFHFYLPTRPVFEIIRKYSCEDEMRQMRKCAIGLQGQFPQVCCFLRFCIKNC